MSFLSGIFDRLAERRIVPVLVEVHHGRLVSATGAQLLDLVTEVRRVLAERGVRKGDRCVILAPNSIYWAAIDLAVMAHGAIAVPMYSRQATSELVAMMKDASPTLILCGDDSLADSIRTAWPDAPAVVTFDEVISGINTESVHEWTGDEPVALADDDVVTIIYTSGTSGDAKGVMLTAGNLNHMVACTTAQLDQVLVRAEKPDVLFHYLPFCFCGSWIMLLTSLTRGSLLALSTDLDNVRDEIKMVKPHLFMNVPTFLERVRRGVEQKLATGAGPFCRLYRRSVSAWQRTLTGQVSGADRFWLRLADALVFRGIRRAISPRLTALVCGSAPLSLETQQFFAMLKVPVLQVYGLTETTAICTMDAPNRVKPGWVGQAIEATQMKLGEHDEILVRGAHVFAGYWNRPDETASVLTDGWFHTGDQGEVDDDGYWRIVGRIKNLVILNSGHNIAPEPMEEALLARLAGAVQVVLIGNDRSYLTAIVTGPVDPGAIAETMERYNEGLPHYKRVRAWMVVDEPFSAENGLLTANGKLKRDAIAARFAERIEGMYRRQSP